MKIKNSKFIKFFIVCLVCVFGFFGVNCVVNADSINDTPDYQYMKTSYYNWDNITWYTENNTYVTGSNDTFSTESEFIDYYSIGLVEEEELYFYTHSSSGLSFTFVLPYDNITFYDLFVNYGELIYYNSSSSYYYEYKDINNDYSIRCYANNSIPYGGVYCGSIGGYPGHGIYLNSTSVNVNSIINANNDYSFSSQGGGGNDDDPGTEQPGTDNEYWRPTEQPGAYSLNARAISSSDYSFLIERNNIYNDSLSDIDLFVYDSVLSTDLLFDSIVFEKSEFFVKVGDLNTLNVPMISASVLNGGFDITFEISGYVRDVNGNVRDLSIVTNERNNVLNYQSLFPTFQELFGNIESVNNNSMMYINYLRVLVEFPNNYVDNLSYRYSISSIESNNIKYGGAFNQWVNSSINANLGGSLVDNINTFLQIEILPGLSFFGILLLAVAVPMLIWILKIFFGG